ncbi:hypothetical protein EUTSA_v10026619mg [Eutrema salsugineum]|uniref:Uncharacterized protein n=1 Tax=Eutrema salsugineum TaxID=72664 RepID=V4MPB2_EUTSA|nr:hypothetical protein EUTSA_v10026619mg [Eutrema salsugineum]ESQ54858.1 hypothetical protein EUTSA_v10026619mg [Eutrema salsugineum]
MNLPILLIQVWIFGKIINHCGGLHDRYHTLFFSTKNSLSAYWTSQSVLEILLKFCSIITSKAKQSVLEIFFFFASMLLFFQERYLILLLLCNSNVIVTQSYGKASEDLI